MAAETTWLTSTQLEAWRRLVAVVHQLPRRLEEPLAPHGLSFFHYSILAMLSDAPDRTLAMGHLAALTNSSPSRLSHAARGLEDEGLICREPSPQDGRVTLATLTEQGLETLVEVAPVHVDSVRALVFDALEEEQVEQLGLICGRVLARVAPDLAPPWGSATDW